MPCDPLSDLRAWQQRLERLAAQHGSGWDPPIDVYETEDRYVITAEVPGLSREQIDVAVHDNRLTIKGIRSGGNPESSTRHYHQIERGHGSFERTFRFADPVEQDRITADLHDGEQDRITADLHDGVLTITLPKTAAPPRRIQVS